MRILIIKLSSLGDLFHALPAVHNLKTELNASIDWVTNKSYVDLVKCFDDTDHVIGFPRKNFMANFREFASTLRQDEYDLIIDLQGLLKSALTARLARGKRRIGPSFHREGSRIFYNSVASPKDRNRHAVIENLDIISHLDLTLHKPEFHVTFPPSSLLQQDRQLHLDYGNPDKSASRSAKVAICPSSRWHTKNWPTERFAEVAAKLQTELAADIILLGGPDDIETCRSIEEVLPAACQNLAGKTSLIEMGSILQQVDLLISNDSGPSHMAAAVNTPTLVIFGPTNPDRTRPFGDNHHVLKTSYPCQPCHSRVCQNPDIPCITGVKVYQVFDKAREILTKLN
jgi:lipopolysaccharide heptosyltransferase I